MDGNAVNVDVTAPGAIIALALMFLKVKLQYVVFTMFLYHYLLEKNGSSRKFLMTPCLLQTESETIVSKLSIPHTHFDLQYVRPDFIMLRVIARNLIMWSR